MTRIWYSERHTMYAHSNSPRHLAEWAALVGAELPEEDGEDDE